ncbi:MAG: tRNA (adenosine(37)-N6)-threonylcarbamoyltransferase complex ATPase subunit type 1 TsaE [Marinilabiliaceae bacterium]|nr:tRNA (adenosine(37)-N6)-threonylcarbamoyltransferase complex ATPase subunit type 1 TsaE [Marinilabiliaceae bacterium]
MEYIVNNVDDLPMIAKEVVKMLNKIKIVALYGSLGAGKTTFIKAICKELKTDDNVNSPSFSIVNEYVTENRTIYHFDLYRLNNINELFDIGFEEYFDSGNVCFIEWPQIVEDYLPKEHINITISLLENGKRLILIK